MRIKEIQALRALASILVVIYHARLIRGGYIGVDIFYVISGYLITGLLLRELQKTQTISFSAFYLRRIKRLLPTSFFVLITTGLAAWLLYPATMRHELGRDIAAAGIYISNYLFALWQMDYQNLDAIPPVVIHYWSLAVEEQFYLFWPFLIFILFKRGGRTTVLRGVAIITALSFLWSYSQTRTSPIWAFYSLPTRAWELGIGALLLFIPELQAVKRSGKSLALAALLAIFFGSSYFKDSTPFPGTAALIPVLATALAIATIGHWPRILTEASHLRFVQWLGEISYPLYLWHWPLLVIPAVYFGRGLHIYERAICIIATLLLAHLTHRFIEEPLRHRQLPRKAIVRISTLATITSLLLGTAIYLTHTDQIQVGGGKSYSLSKILEKPKVYNDGCHVNNGETKSADCTYGVRGAKTKIVLFGDSHAAQWFPALEKLAFAHGFELISLTKSACPGPAVVKVNTGNYKNADCSAWRSNSYRRIASIHPEAVIVSGMEHFEIPAGYSSRSSWWREGEAATLAQLQGSAQHLIYLTDTPKPLRDIPSCVAAGVLKKCNLTKPSDPYTISGFTNINPTAWLCTATCPAIIGNQVVYRDASHLSVGMSQQLSAKLYRALLADGVNL